MSPDHRYQMALAIAVWHTEARWPEPQPAHDLDWLDQLAQKAEEQP